MDNQEEDLISTNAMYNRFLDKYEDIKNSDDYVAKLEARGLSVHYPPRDVDQTDDGCGLEILSKHRDVMINCKEVHVIWDENSKGSHFDLGMAFILSCLKGTRIKYAFRPKQLPHKSFNNVLILLNFALSISFHSKYSLKVFS